jgi:hypothetical protein
MFLVRGCSYSGRVKGVQFRICDYGKMALMQRGIIETENPEEVPGISYKWYGKVY